MLRRFRVISSFLAGTDIMPLSTPSGLQGNDFVNMNDRRWLFRFDILLYLCNYLDQYTQTLSCRVSWYKMSRLMSHPLRSRPLEATVIDISDFIADMCS